MLEVAGSLEQASEHPLARSIVDHAIEKSINLKDVQDFESVTGGGVKGKLDHKEIFLGKAKFIEEVAGQLPQGLRDQAARWQEKAQTVVWVAAEKSVLGMQGIADPIKQSTPAAIKALHQMGRKVVMLTGDNQRTAQAIAKEALQ